MRAARRDSACPTRRPDVWGPALILGAGVLAVLAVLLLPAAPGRAGAQPTIHVVTTLPPLADLVARIGGERVSVAALLPPGASPHAYEPRPSDLRNVAGADLVVSVGAGLDQWLYPILETSRAGTHLELARTTPLLPAQDEVTPGRDGEAEDDHGHEHGSWDPHFWLDPVLVRDEVAPALAEALAAVDPRGEAVFARNLAALQAELSLLDRELQELLAPHRGTAFVAVHSAWRYFARRYGLEQVAAVQEFPGREPGPAWFAAVIAVAREKGARLVVTEAQFDSRLAQQLARETGARVVALDPLGGPGVAGMESYVDLLRANGRRIAAALEDTGSWPR